MPWVKLDDDFSDHRKIMAVGPLAAWMHVCALCYCARLLTDGFVPAAQVRKLADVDDATSLAALLVREGLWEAVEGGYRIHDYLEYNPSKEEVEATRNVRAEAGRRGGLNSGKTREAKSKQIASPSLDPVLQKCTKQTRSKNEPRTRTHSPTQNPIPKPESPEDLRPSPAASGARKWPYDEPPLSNAPMHAMWKLEGVGGIIAPKQSDLSRELGALKDHLDMGTEEQAVKYFRFQLEKNPNFAAPSKWGTGFATSLARHRATSNGSLQTTSNGTGQTGSLMERAEAIQARIDAREAARND